MLNLLLKFHRVTVRKPNDFDLLPKKEKRLTTEKNLNFWTLTMHDHSTRFKFVSKIVLKLAFFQLFYISIIIIINNR